MYLTSIRPASLALRVCNFVITPSKLKNAPSAVPPAMTISTRYLREKHNKGKDKVLIHMCIRTERYIYKLKILRTIESRQHEHCRIAQTQKRRQCAAVFTAFGACSITPPFVHVNASNSPDTYEVNVLHVGYQNHIQSHNHQHL